MGIIINQRIVLNAAYHGKRVIGMANSGLMIWRSDLSYFNFDPDNIEFDNDAYQHSKVFLVTATGAWEIEELL